LTLRGENSLAETMEGREMGAGNPHAPEGLVPLLDRPSPDRAAISKILAEHGLGSTPFAGGPDGLYERHLMFDNAVALPAVGKRERFEAFARSVRDLLTDRWLRTKQTYERKNPKRVYYLSMEFLIGRSLGNNVTNLLLDPIVADSVRRDGLDWLGLLDQEPDA